MVYWLMSSERGNRKLDEEKEVERNRKNDKR
jgi:hypothetical protein